MPQCLVEESATIYRNEIETGFQNDGLDMRMDAYTLKRTTYPRLSHFVNINSNRIWEVL